MFKIIFVLIGTFVGAGFASGKEVFNFFTIFSYNGLISILIFSLLIFLLIYKCLNEWVFSTKKEVSKCFYQNF